MESSVRAARHGEILLIQLDSPDKHPRLTRAVLGELHVVFDLLAGVARGGGSSLPLYLSHSDVEIAGARGVVVTGTETAFAAGADLAEVSALSAVEARRFSELGQGLMRKIERCARPVVAAVRGWCLGGGFDLAMACHVRVAGRDAVFGHPGGSLGIVTGWGGTQRLPRIVGKARAMEMLVTGKMVKAAEALEMRLVNRVVETGETVEAAGEWVKGMGRGLEE